MPRFCTLGRWYLQNNNQLWWIKISFYHSEKSDTDTKSSLPNMLMPPFTVCFEIFCHLKCCFLTVQADLSCDVPALSRIPRTCSSSFHCCSSCVCAAMNSIVSRTWLRWMLSQPKKKLLVFSWISSLSWITVQSLLKRKRTDGGDKVGSYWMSAVPQ